MIRKELPTRKTFFDDIRALTRYICFDSWDHMLRFMMIGLELEFPDTSYSFSDNKFQISRMNNSRNHIELQQNGAGPKSKIRNQKSKII